MPADLYEQASGAAALDIRSTGDEAKMINASLPFAAVPVTPAQPFILSGDDDQRARALLCLTQAVYYEANGEPEEGQRAVAQVVLNRVRHPAFAKSVCGVVYEGASSGTCQFSFVCNGSLDRRPAPAAWTRAVGRRGHALSCRLCRAGMGAAARQGRVDRPAHLLSLARPLGRSGRVHGALCR
jgi:hypothetical protein